MREAYIRAMARRYGLDPAAVLAIASHEGLSGGVGDGGHAFGPGQLNDAGGVLTGAPASHHSNKWAWSNEGINFWMRGMAGVAKGLHGRAAIEAIARRYERPADPGAEVRDAMGAYGQYAKGGALPNAPGPGGGGHGPSAVPSRQGLIQTLMAQNEQFARTGQADPMLIQSALQNGFTEKDQAGMGNQRGPKGTALQTGGKLGSVIQTAVNQIGTPYLWGGTTKAGFDCSGLIQFAYAKHGIDIPRTTYDQMKVGKKVGWGNFKAGDLIFTNGGEHVVMYIGNGQAISAPHTGAKVHTFDINDVRSDFYTARRVAHN